MLRMLALGKWSKDQKRWAKLIDIQNASRTRLGPRRAVPKPRPAAPK